MAVTHLLHTYGYAAVFLITLINFSTGLVIAGFAAHQGYLNLLATLSVACLGSFVFAELYFLIACFGVAKFLTRHPESASRLEEFNLRFKSKKGRLAACVLFRFIPGFRILMPFLLGSIRMSFLSFSIHNFIGSVVWTLIFSLLGYYFGAVASIFLKDIKHYEVYLAAAILVIAAVWWLVYYYCFRKRWSRY